MVESNFNVKTLLPGMCVKNTSMSNKGPCRNRLLHQRSHISPQVLLFQPIILCMSKTGQHSSTAPFSSYKFNKEGFLCVINNLKHSEEINWKAWAHERFPVVTNSKGNIPTNAGHILKSNAEHCGIDRYFPPRKSCFQPGNSQEDSAYETESLASKYGIPFTRPVKVIKQDRKQETQDGDIVIENTVVLVPVTNKSGSDCDCVFSRHVPLHHIHGEELGLNNLASRQNILNHQAHRRRNWRNNIRRCISRCSMTMLQ